MTIDRFLQSYVISANVRTDPSKAMTLCVGGTLVSGQIIGANLYKTLCRVQGDSQASADDIEAFDQLFDECKDEDQFIHLRNVLIVLPTGQQISRIGLWRGQLTAVDGFFFGLLTST